MGGCTLARARSLVTVEPVLLLYSLAGGLRGVVLQTLLYDKVCVTYYNSTVCDNLKQSNYSEQETHVQQMSSKWEFYEILVFTLPSIFVNLIYGAVSDRISRKAPMLLSSFGAIIYTAILLLMGIYIQAPIAWILLGTVVNALTGGGITMLTCTLSLLSAITTEKSRTLRISIAEAMMLLSNAVAHFVSGDLLRATSFTFIFSLVIVLNLLVILYVIFWLTDVDVGNINDKYKKEDPPQRENAQETEKPAAKPSGCKGWMKVLCDTSYMTDSVKVTFKKREQNRRAYVVTQVAIIACFIMAIAPSWTLSYLFLRHEPLSWDPAMYGHFAGLNIGLRGVCLLLALPLLKKFAGLMDTTLMLLGTASGMVSLVMFGLSTQGWMVFTVPVLGFFTPGTIISIRGLISTMVEKSELGKIFGMVASVEALSFLLASCFFNYLLYPKSVTFYPGLSFLIGAAFMIGPILMSSWLHIGVRRQARYRTLIEDTTCAQEVTVPQSGPHQELQTVT